MKAKSKPPMEDETPEFPIELYVLPKLEQEPKGGNHYEGFDVLNTALGADTEEPGGWIATYKLVEVAEYERVVTYRKKA